jgi:peptidoglycan/xylan/chitin deacetylase (PgdA/CDA1 family)
VQVIKTLKKITKTLLAGIFYYGGLFYLYRFMNNRAGRRLTILAYHRVTKKNIEDIRASLPTLFVTEKSFAKQLEFIKKHFTIITFSDLKAFVQGEGLPPNSLIITFDDGYEDNYTNAYPIMSSMNVRSVMFLASNKIGLADASPYWWDRAYYYLQNPEWYAERAHTELEREVEGLLQEFNSNTSKLFGRLDKEDTRVLDQLLNSIQVAYRIPQDILRDENRILDWDQVKTMRREVEFGSHTCNHYNLVALDVDSVSKEVSQSSQLIKTNAGCSDEVFSYPGGNYDERVKRAVAAAGYDFAVTTEVGVNDLADRYALKRVSVWEGTSRGMNRKFSKSLFAFKLLGN